MQRGSTRISSTIRQALSKRRSRTVQVEHIASRQEAQLGMPVVHLPENKKKRVVVAKAAKPKKTSRKRAKAKDDSFIGLARSNAKKLNRLRKAALDRALGRRSDRSRKVVYETPGTGEVRISTRPADPSRRGNPSKSYAVGLSRGLPGNEDVDP